MQRLQMRYGRSDFKIFSLIYLIKIYSLFWCLPFQTLGVMHIYRIKFIKCCNVTFHPVNYLPFCPCVYIQIFYTTSRQRLTLFTLATLPYSSIKRRLYYQLTVHTHSSTSYREHRRPLKAFGRDPGHHIPDTTKQTRRHQCLHRQVSTWRRCNCSSRDDGRLPQLQMNVDLASLQSYYFAS